MTPTQTVRAVAGGIVALAGVAVMIPGCALVVIGSAIAGDRDDEAYARMKAYMMHPANRIPAAAAVRDRNVWPFA